jgi:hypothetical protein
VDIQGNFT